MFFSDADKQSISEAIRAVETTTAGEIAVMVVDESDSYPESILLAGFIPGFLIALLFTDLFFDDSLWYFLALCLPAVLCCALVACQFPALRRWFTPNNQLEARVSARALQAFYEKRLYRTRDNTGVLFFISLAEHKVWVLADKGINAKIAAGELQEFASDVARGVKEGQAARILCKEIHRIGEILALHFPVQDDDVNELSDEVITG